MKLVRKLVLPALLLSLLAGCGPRPGPGGSSVSTPPPGPALPEHAFTRESLPRLDGSTSTAPLAQAMCAVLLGESRESVADLIRFSRTTQSYRSLMNGDADLLLSAEPAPEMAAELEAEGRWRLTPFATDALVFVVNEDNPVDDLTSEQVRQIYTGRITNWKEVGGDDLPIVPFQRNAEAGSQTLFEKLAMGGEEPMEPPVHWVADSMMGLLDAVREYDNSPAAIGYTVYYYANDMEMAKGLKVLSIDGQTPSAAAIQAGTYPYLNPYYVAVAKDLPDDDPARILCDWVLGPDGRRLAGEMGYVPAGSGAGPAYAVRADWSRLEDAPSPAQTDTDGGRWYPGYTDRLIPRNDYGALYPFIGDQGFTNQSFGMEYVDSYATPFYGLMTRTGKIVVDPVYTGAAPVSVWGEDGWRDLPVLALSMAKPEWDDFNNGGRIAIAAADGSWVTDFEFLMVTARGDQLLLVSPEGLTRMDSAGGSRADWSWDQLGLGQADLQDLLGDLRWGIGFTWLEQGVLLSVDYDYDNYDTSTAYIFHPEDGTVTESTMDHWQAWMDEDYAQHWADDSDPLIMESWEGDTLIATRGGERLEITTPAGLPAGDSREFYPIGDRLIVGAYETGPYYLIDLSGKVLLEGDRISQTVVHGGLSTDGFLVRRGGAVTLYDGALKEVVSVAVPADAEWIRGGLLGGLMELSSSGSFAGYYDPDAGRWVMWRNFDPGD